MEAYYEVLIGKDTHECVHGRRKEQGRCRKRGNRMYEVIFIIKGIGNKSNVRGLDEFSRRPVLVGAIDIPYKGHSCFNRVKVISTSIFLYLVNKLS